jgi:hypothetical protein
MMRSPDGIEMSELNHLSKYDDDVLSDAASAEHWNVVFDGLESRYPSSHQPYEILQVMHVQHNSTRVTHFFRYQPNPSMSPLYKILKIACIQRNFTQVKSLFKYEPTLKPRNIISDVTESDPSSRGLSVGSSRSLKHAFEKTLLKAKFPRDSEFIRENLLAFFNPEDLTLAFLLQLLGQALLAKEPDNISFYLLTFLDFARNNNEVHIDLNERLDVLDSAGSWSEAEIVGKNANEIEVSYVGRPAFYNEKIDLAAVSTRCAQYFTYSRFQPFFNVVIETNSLQIAVDLVKACNMPAEALITFNRLYRDHHWKFVRGYLTRVGKAKFSALFLNGLLMRAIATDHKNSALEFLLSFIGSASSEHMGAALQCTTTWQLSLLFKKYPLLRNNAALSQAAAGQHWDTLVAYIDEVKPPVEVLSPLVVPVCNGGNFALLKKLSAIGARVPRVDNRSQSISQQALMLTLAEAKTVEDWNFAFDTLKAYSPLEDLDGVLLRPVVLAAIRTPCPSEVFTFLIAVKSALHNNHINEAVLHNSAAKLSVMLQQCPEISDTSSLLARALEKGWSCIFNYLAHRSVDVKVLRDILLAMLEDTFYPELVMQLVQRVPNYKEVFKQCWINILNDGDFLKAFLKAQKLFILNPIIGCEVFQASMEAGSKCGFFHDILKEARNIKIAAPFLRNFFSIAAKRSSVDMGVFLVVKYQKDFIVCEHPHHERLLTDLIAYCCMRKAENREYSRFSIWGRFNGFSSKLKIAAALKVIEKLMGGAVQLSELELKACHNGRLGEIFKKHHAMDVIFPQPEIFKESFRRFF